jgi:hypothetical protein
MLDDRDQIGGATVVEIRSVLLEPRNGVVQYRPVADRNAYAGSIPVWAGWCRNRTLGSGPLNTSVNIPPS